MSEDCIFCKIIEGEIPSTKVYETENTYAFEDVDPKAPVHVLIVPKPHIPTVNDISGEHASLLGEMMSAAGEVAKLKGVSEGGYRLVVNTNRDAGQVVFHLHMHLMGGRALGPMG